MKLRKVVLFTLLFASVLFLAACDEEERKEYYDNGALQSIVTYCNGEKSEAISFYENALYI